MPYVKKLLLASAGALALFLMVWQYLIHFAPAFTGVRNADKKSLPTERAVMRKLFSGFERFQLIAKTKNNREPASEIFLKLYREETGNGVMEKNSPVVCHDWGGAQTEYYFCYFNNIPVIGLGEPNELHEYLFINATRKDKANLNTAYCLVPADDDYDVRLMFSACYDQIEKPSPITVKRKGKPVVTFYVYRLRGWKGQLPMVAPE